MRTILLIVSIFFFASTLHTQIAITKEGSTIDGSAMLDVQSNNSGFLPPRMTTTQRNDITSPADGLIIYNTTSGCIEFYKEGSWVPLCGGSGTGRAGYTIGGGGACINTVLGGEYMENVTLSNNTVTIDAEVASIGSWNVTTNAENGYSFSGNGVFNSTGTQQIVLNGAGEPAAVQTDNFTATADNEGGTCTFSISVTTIGTVTTATGEVWLDRNLGALQIATSSTDAAALGDLYQWGRLRDGHENRDGVTTTSTLSNMDDPGHSDFILVGGSPYDWRNPRNDLLWQGLSGINNPCPGGFRLPTSAEFTAEVAEWSSANEAGAFGSELKLTLGGIRSGNNGIITPTYNGYWTSTVSTVYAWWLNITSTAASQFEGGRRDGMAVRCIQD